MGSRTRPWFDCVNPPMRSMSLRTTNAKSCQLTVTESMYKKVSTKIFVRSVGRKVHMYKYAAPRYD